MTDPVTVLVIDDERPAREKLVRLLSADARFVLVGEARDGIEALEQIERLRPDLLLLDIQMPGLSGFELLDALEPEHVPGVVFSTAHDEHALRAFDAHAVDYLLKPYDAARFARALDKVYHQHLGARGSDLRVPLCGPLAAPRRHLALKTVAGCWLLLALEDIVRITAANKYACVHTRDERHLVRKPLRALAERLDARFLRVHRSDIVNVDAVTKVAPWDHGDALLTLRGDTTVVLTRTFRKAFMARMDIG